MTLHRFLATPLAYRWCRRAGWIVLTLTYDEPWRCLGWHDYRTDWRDLAWAAAQDYVLAIGLLALTLVLLVSLSRRRQTAQVLFGIALCVAALAYVAVASGVSAGSRCCCLTSTCFFWGSAPCAPASGMAVWAR